MLFNLIVIFCFFGDFLIFFFFQAEDGIRDIGVAGVQTCALPISRLMADLFKTAGAGRLITIDLHTDQIQGFFDGPVDHLMALPVLTDYVRDRYGEQNLAIVSPDAGRIKVAERWSARLGGAPLTFIHKTRDIRRPNESVANRVVGEVQGRMCILVDDMIDTGGTRSEEHTSELQSRQYLVCRLLLENKHKL